MDSTMDQDRDFSNVVAIDFGTSYSGYAFSHTSRGAKSDPYLRRWKSPQGGDTPKTPTCILFNKNGEFMMFGYEALEAYMNMTGDESNEHYFFQDFKMILHDSKPSKDLMIKAANGKEMEAMKVFTESLRFLKDDALKNISSYLDTKFETPDFTWVLTVPAIWSPAAKQFIREAAAQAGIVTEEKLAIALEPEAASLWCKKVPAEGFITQYQDGDKLDQNPGTQYIVVDCGGGTTDITVHKILKGGFLKELHKASGNDLGGQTVDRTFKKFLKEIFGDVWEKYENKFPNGVQRMMNDFTFLKQENDEMYISCSHHLIELAQEKKPIESFFESVEGASWAEEYIIITREKLRSFFKDSLEGITESLKKILQEKIKINYILLVGGFAESEILRQHVQEKFGDQNKILCPSRPQEAIVRGAVEFGRNPGLVTSRKSRFTYGVGTIEPFKMLKHKPEKKFTVAGKDWCPDVFRKLVQEGENVLHSETRELKLHVIDTGETEMKIRFYKTDKKKTKYVDEEGVEPAGSFNIRLKNPRKDRERTVGLEVKFGSTEISATGTDLISGQKYTGKLDFLTT